MGLKIKKTPSRRHALPQPCFESGTTACEKALRRPCPAHTGLDRLAQMCDRPWDDSPAHMLSNTWVFFPKTPVPSFHPRSYNLGAAYRAGAVRAGPAERAAASGGAGAGRFRARGRYHGGVARTWREGRPAIAPPANPFWARQGFPIRPSARCSARICTARSRLRRTSGASCSGRGAAAAPTATTRRSGSAARPTRSARSSARPTPSRCGSRPMSLWSREPDAAACVLSRRHRRHRPAVGMRAEKSSEGSSKARAEPHRWGTAPPDLVLRTSRSRWQGNVPGAVGSGQQVHLAAGEIVDGGHDFDLAFLHQARDHCRRFPEELGLDPRIGRDRRVEIAIRLVHCRPEIAV
jgi:hypothetical protein